MNDEVVMGDVEIECTFNTSGLNDYKERLAFAFGVKGFVQRRFKYRKRLCCRKRIYQGRNLELYDGEKLVLDFKSPNREVLKRLIPIYRA